MCTLVKPTSEYGIRDTGYEDEDEDEDEDELHS